MISKRQVTGGWSPGVSPLGTRDGCRGPEEHPEAVCVWQEAAGASLPGLLSQMTVEGLRLRALLTWG